jgi:TonB family protein
MSPFPILVPLALSLRLTLVAVDPEMRPPAGSTAREEKTDASGDSLPRPGEYSNVEELPEAVTKTPPIYPEEAKRAGVQGTVMVEALIGRDGLVKSTRILASIPALDAAAVEAVSHWVFKPAHTDGKPVAVRVVIPVKFTLRPGAAAEPSRASAAFESALFQLKSAGALAPFGQDAILRERIIRLALALNPGPEIPEAARRHFQLGRASLDSLPAPGAVERAIGELSAALTEAPWWAEPHFLLANAFETAGRPTDAAVALDLYRVADPRSPRWEEVRRRLGELRAAAAPKPAR